MNKLTTAALGAAVAALPVLAASPAFAQDGPVLTAEASVACGRVTLTADVLRNLLGENDRYEIAVSGGAEGKLGAELGRMEVRFVGDAVSKTFTFDEDEFGGTAIVTWNTVQGPERDAFVSGAVEVDTDCTDEEPTPTPTPTPAPTTTPTTTPTTPPAADDVDCDEVSDDEAQRILDADRSDPHNLDEDDDGVACEDEEIVVKREVVTVPSGGVNTGGWQK